MEGKVMNDNMVYTVKEVAKILHSSPNYIYKLIENGYLPALKLGSIKDIKIFARKVLENNLGKDFSNLDDIKELKITMEDGDIDG